MEKVRIYIDWMDHNFEAAPQNDAVACVATGKTLEEVEANIVQALSKETGIKEQQLSHYATGRKIPRPVTQRKIAEGIQSISRRLSFIF
jgi:hypothetical protein